MSQVTPSGSYLSKRGYVIRKDSISKDELIFLKRTLIAKPLQDDKFNTFNKRDISFPIYIETQNKIYIPKMFGINRYGFPDKLMPNYIGISWENDIQFNGNLYPIQEEAVKTLVDELKNGKSGGILSIGTGLGKCHKKNTPILMYDGTIKMVQDIQVGDLLMGDNSQPRTVLSLANGIDDMFDVTSENNEVYTVNKEHVLCLQLIKNKKSHVIEIPVKDYITLPVTLQSQLKGYKTQIDFTEQKIPYLNPYLLGYTLAKQDGSKMTDMITIKDYIVLNYFIQNDKKYNFEIESVSKNSFKIHGLLGVYNQLQIDDHVIIPHNYKCNTKEIRLSLLAGIIDSEGYLHENNSFIIYHNSETFANDIVYLARSLGFSCDKMQIKENWKRNNKNITYQITINGNIGEWDSGQGIPSLLIAPNKSKSNLTNCTLSYSINVKYSGKDEYFGFTLDGNCRYVMGDFTVTHNTISALNVLSQIKGKTIVIVNKIPLMKQWESEIKQFLPDANIGFIQGQKNISVKDKDIIIAMLQSLARIDYPDSLFEDIKTIVVDEIHNLSSRVFSQVLSKLSCQYSIGLSATPKRSDGCEYVFKHHIGEIVYKADTERKGKPPIIRYLKIDSKDYKEINTINPITGQNQIQFTSMLSELIEMDKRNKLIIEIIKDCRKQKRKILVLSDRRNHLQLLYNLLDKDQNISFTYGLFLGSMKITDLDKSRACDVILATYTAFGEGVSEKDLNTLLLLTPKKFIGHLKNTTKNESGKLEQIVGRVFRKDHITTNPLIIDFQDNFSVYKTQSNGRRKFYKEHFKNAIFEETYINLDDHDHDNIHASLIKTKKKTEQIENNENGLNNVLNNLCIIDDD